MTTAAEIAWAAGLFEGEGSVHCARRSDRKTGSTKIGMTVRMTDQDVVVRFHQILGVGSFYGPIRHIRKQDGKQLKDVYEWRTHNWQVIAELFALFQPWLGQRRCAQFQHALASAKPKLVRKAESLPPDCGILTPGEISKRGERTHARNKTPICVACWQAQLAYERKRERPNANAQARKRADHFRELNVALLTNPGTNTVAVQRGR